MGKLIKKLDGILSTGNLVSYINLCHPYHSWEKESIENTVGLIKQYLPKKLILHR